MDHSVEEARVEHDRVEGGRVDEPVPEQGGRAAVDVGADLSGDRRGDQDTAADRLTGLVGDGDTDDR